MLAELLGDEAAAGLEPGDDAIALLGLADEVVEVNVTPDRGYCFSMRGIAREYALSTGAAFRDPRRPRRVAGPTTAGMPCSSPTPRPSTGVAGCDRYVARVVRGVDVTASSPRWMQKRLTQVGMRPISLAVDVTNYVMMLLGQPLHAFDLDTLSGSVGTRRARAGEQLTTLDDVERALDPEDLLIVDGADTPLAIAGVMGGATSEVTGTTTDVLIEAAHFDPITVARSSRRHRLTTEASKRFERGVDHAVRGGRGPAGRRPAGRARRRHRRRGRHRRRPPGGRLSRSTSTPPCRRATSGSTTRATRCWRRCARSAAT